MVRVMFARALCLLPLLIGCAGAVPRPPHAREDAGAFARLSSIVGAWEAQTETGALTADYALISRDSALVESWVTPGGTHTLTVYHPDGPTVLLTHYCAQGNQARLRLVEASESRFRFEREDATNVLAGQSVLTTLELSLEDGALVRTEVYVDPAGTPERTVLRFERARPPT